MTLEMNVGREENTIEDRAAIPVDLLTGSDSLMELLHTALLKMTILLLNCFFSIAGALEVIPA